jgi:RNA polymerase sigma factor (sigma-70 family)
MNGTDAGGVHDPMDATATADPVTAPLTFEGFFEAERRRLLRALVVLAGNPEEAEEVLQDAFLALWERWERVASLDDPTGYLYRTALNRQRSRVRRTLRAAKRAVGVAHGGDLFAEADERDAVARALAQLTPRRREAIVMTEMLGYGSAEAGRAMGVSDVTVRRLAQEARADLRRALEENDDDG